MESEIGATWCYMLLWQVLVRVRGEYEEARAAGRVLEWIAERLSKCFMQTRDNTDQPWEVEEPEGWNRGRAFDRNYDALMWLANSDAAPPSGAKRTPRPLTPAIDKTLRGALENLQMVIMARKSRDNKAGTSRCSSARTTARMAEFDNFEEFWQVAFVSFFRPAWLPWRGSYCAGCGRLMPQTKKLKKPSGTTFCSGCRVQAVPGESQDERQEGRQPGEVRWRRRRTAGVVGAKAPCSIRKPKAAGCGGLSPVSSPVGASGTPKGEDDRRRRPCESERRPLRKTNRLPSGDSTTVGEYLDYWLTDVAKPNTRPSTWASYERCVRLHLKPPAGGYPIKRLDTWSTACGPIWQRLRVSGQERQEV